MTEIPERWECIEGQIVYEIVRGVSYKKQDVQTTPEEGLVPVLRANNIQNGRIIANDLVYVPVTYVSDDQYLKAGDILIATSSGSRHIVGKTAMAYEEDSRFAFGAFCAVARPLYESGGRWVYYYSRGREYRDYVEEVALGININNFRTSDLGTLPVPIAPLSEQRRIVAKLDALFARTRQAREELEHIPTLVEYYKQAILSAAFRGELTADWRAQTDYEPASVLLERILNARRARWEAEQLAKYKEKGKKPPKNWQDKYQEPEAPDTSKLPELPEGWRWVAIGQVFGVYVGSTPSRKKSEYWNGDIHWVSSGEVAFCRIRTTRECITQLGLENASTTVHPVGTVLLGMIGEGKTRGQAAILDIPACHNQNSAAIRVSEVGLPAEYVYYFFKGTYEQTRRKGAGNNQPALNKTRVEAMTIPLPPLDKQKAIVQIIEEAFEWLDIVLDEATSALRLLDHLDQANLAKAFRGELVPQDPDDEPASVLLERIREARGLD